MPSTNLDKYLNDNILTNISEDPESNGNVAELPAICDKPKSNNDDQEQKVNNKSIETEEEVITDKKDAQPNEKKKIIVRFSLSKSLDDSGTSEGGSQDNETDGGSQATQTSSAIISRLMSSRAFNRFIQSSLFKCPESGEAKANLRAPDNQRLLNSHESRENSPEPGN